MGTGPDLDHTLVTPLRAGEAVSGDLDAWIAAALSTRPDLNAMVLRKNIAEKEVDKARAARHPSVSLAGNLEVDSEDLSDAGSNYTVGAVVSLPLFTGGRIDAKIREAETDLKQAEAMLRAMEHQVCGETRQAFFFARSAWERIQVAQAAVGQAEESLRIVKNRYNSGLFTITDLLDADVIVQQSLTNRLRAVHDFRAAATRLELAAGTLEGVPGH
jgi:outer membrane protein TolC